MNFVVSAMRVSSELSWPISDWMLLLASVVQAATVRRLDGQVTHALQDRVGLVQGALSGLDDGDAVLSVADTRS